LSAENVSLTDRVAEMNRTIERLRKWLDRREQQLGECSQQLRESQEALQDSQCIIQQMDDRQDEVNRVLEQLKCRVSFLTTENDSLTAQIADKDKTVDEFQERLRTALQTVREACESVSSIVKAVSMLKYDRENGYGIELTEKQGRLIDAIVKYGSRWMDKTDEKIGISQGIQENIQALTPKKLRGRGEMYL
jgi:chromosome segregation ATPase